LFPTCIWIGSRDFLLEHSPLEEDAAGPDRVANVGKTPEIRSRDWRLARRHRHPCWVMSVSAQAIMFATWNPIGEELRSVESFRQTA